MPNSLIYKDEINQILDTLAAQAHKDRAFKERLLTEPKALLQENGFELPEALQLKLIEETDPNQITLYLPPEPSGELSDEDLEAVSGGGFGEKAEGLLKQWGAAMGEMLKRNYGGWR